MTRSLRSTGGFFSLDNINSCSQLAGFQVLDFVGYNRSSLKPAKDQRADELAPFLCAADIFVCLSRSLFPQCLLLPYEHAESSTRKVPATVLRHSQLSGCLTDSGSGKPYQKRKARMMPPQPTSDGWLPLGPELKLTAKIIFQRSCFLRNLLV
jgi:hypothetical protein